MKHQPVLLQEVLESLAPQTGETFVDATINRGGHSRAICQRLGSSGLLIGIDADQGALLEAKENLSGCPCPVRLIPTNFREIVSKLGESGIGNVDCILMDLGMSSHELEISGRGFSFRRDEPLIMTFDSSPAEDDLTAEKIVNYWSEKDLAKLIWEYGEERFAKPIARGLVEARQRSAIATTFELVEAIKLAVPEWYRHRRIHFATKTFQALRMAVNDELGALQAGLTGAWQSLAIGGRLGVISFHSLEARLVKNYFQFLVRNDQASFVHKKAIRPSYAEIKQNPRARSAQLRTIKKTK